MKLKQIALLVMLLPMVACGPSMYTMEVEMRSPSASGYDFTGRSIGIVYVHGAQPGDSTLCAGLADQLAAGLEIAYNDGETVIPFYTLPYSQGADYAAKDTLVNYMVALDHDVLFLISGADVQAGTADVSVLDAMDKTEKVHTYQSVSNQIDLGLQFSPVWTRENHMLFFYDNQKWLEAADLAASMDFSAAMEKFLALAGTGTADRKASAAYDIAYCCYMLGEYSLALEWLKQCEAYYSLPDTAKLRRLIINRKKLTLKH